MDIITCDFETYYDDEYSLSKMTTESYVRDPRFEIIGVGIKMNDGKAVWHSRGSLDEYATLLRPLGRNASLSHNAMFDAFILGERLGIHPPFILDTLSMARPLHGLDVGGSLAKLMKHYGVGEKGDEVIRAKGKRLKDFTPDELRAYGVYCKGDVDGTWDIFQRMKGHFTQGELRLIDMTVRMFTKPLLELDRDLLFEHLKEVRLHKHKLLNAVIGGADPAVLRSNQKFANLLTSLGVEPPMKMSAATGKETYALSKSDKDFTALLEHPDERVQTLVAARLGIRSTIAETRAERMLEISQRGKLPVPLNYGGAFVTTRWSGGDKLNLQNLTRGSKLREAIRAPEGYVLLAGDSANIELRVNHTLAGQEDSIESFRMKRDLYCEFASILYGIAVTPEMKDKRFVGKLAHLSLGYGCGVDKFMEICRLYGLILEREEAERIVRLWRETYDRIPAFWNRANRCLSDILFEREVNVDPAGLVKTCSQGLRTPPRHMIRYPGLALNMETNEYGYNSRGRVVKLFGGKVVENICQHLARNIIADQWLKVAKTRIGDEPLRVVLQAHDELVVCVRESHAEEAKGRMEAIMSTSPDWWPQVPLAAEVGVGRTYKDAK